MLVEARRAAQLASADSTAADLLLRALPGMVRLERLSFARSGKVMRRALAMQPDHAPAHLWYASWLGLRVSQGWTEDPAADRADAMDHATRAMLLDPRDARGFTIAGHIQAFLNRNPAEGAALHAHALALNPNLPMA